ncbi:hypothetical protein HmCmsJML095_03440 [Escherichia coli]|uniref:spore coat protein U domain-containing protein n=1 Tax=Escherichia coli TaxID=562 RepID=UPI0010E56A14|nr:spore coat protein U domain-containing protein [Escherichia coli]GCP46317.1 hypothetical protein ExPECSC017_01184 [Escherichia coli]GCY69486.1 hypothetical protein HmCmsJML095_03440 [Escherichia coli]
MMKNIFYFFLFLNSGYVQGKQIWHFWVPQTVVGDASGSVEIDDSTMTIPIKMSGTSHYNSELALLEKNVDRIEAKEYKRYERTWSLTPADWQVDPVSQLRYKIVSFGEVTSSNVPGGFESRATPEKELSNALYQEALYVGYINPGVVWDAKTWEGYLEIERGSAKPGNYELSIPVRIGIETNIYTTSKTELGNPWVNIPSKQLQFPVNNIKVSVVVTSKCNFNTSPINLSHGTMIGRNADGNQTSPYNLNVTCTPGTSLSVKLLGTQKVSGKTDNYTQCGTGGMCELTFDNGKYDETMIIDNSKTLSIKSTYRLNDIAKPVAESFEGSGVLQVLVN